MAIALIEEQICKISCDARCEGRVLEKIVLSLLDWETFKNEIDRLPRKVVSDPKEREAHCKTCKCAPYVTLATPAGLVRVEKGVFTCAYIVWPGAKIKP